MAKKKSKKERKSESRSSSRAAGYTKEYAEKYIELIQDVGLISLGLLSMTKDRADSMAEKFFSATDDSKEEGRKMEKRLTDMAEKGRKRVRAVIKERTAEVLDELDVATKDDLRNLEKKVKK
jgi:polyhydroxyalkanoate synthesis regulator phasin